MRTFGVGRVHRNGHLVEPHQGAFPEGIVDDLDAVLGLPGAVAGLQNVAGPAEGDADIAVGEGVDVFAGMEFGDIGTHGAQNRLGLLDDIGVVAVGVLAEVGQGGGNHLGGSVKEIDAAGGQFLHVVGVEDQFEGVQRRVIAEDFAHFDLVGADAGGAPHVVDGVAVAFVIAVGAVFDQLPEMLAVGQFAVVEGLEGAGLDLALQELAGRHYDIVAGAAGEQFGLENFVGVEDIVDQVDAGLLLEFGEQLLVDVVGPVVDAHLIGVGGSGGDGQQCGRGYGQKGFHGFVSVGVVILRAKRPDAGKYAGRKRRSQAVESRVQILGVIRGDSG